jgi:hypothetical protein
MISVTRATATIVGGTRAGPGCTGRPYSRP